MKLTPELLLSAYVQGVFPMAHDDGIYWYDPDPRAVLPLDSFHCPRRLGRTVRKGIYDVRINTCFRDVIEQCAAPERDGGWINDDIIAAYTRMHELGFAHSVEVWQHGELVGGLYGVAIRGLFAGESMFSTARDASKVALVHLVRRLRERGYALLDVQFDNAHLQQFGLITIPRTDYRFRLTQALQIDAYFD
ncbi:MAG: leucyl/phenylalanyl-tRNA--protein transferase [Anaerolineae bacterium]|nr:leucyl/phenylalanyl-tRNA--protein transferase [Anaerolineae bacterium]MCO5197363.1 leucyl/phenylalanyl-tRNA--protein transferase [Anaerolineae bacterium]MCO5205005.1 leucyl/phenylalanyl-tRNA--protein transferase [Anaerolineae bacterium]